MIVATSQAGKEIRLGNIVNTETGRSVTVAVDHGSVVGPIEGLESVESAVESFVSSCPEGVLMTFGAAKKYYKTFVGKSSPGLVLRMDSPLWVRLVSPFKNSNPTASLFTISDALRLGASAVLTTLVLGLNPAEMEIKSMEYAGNLVGECEKWGMPLIIETLVLSKKQENENVDIDSLKMICRAASEIGADIIKAPYAGSTEAMKEVVKSSFAPILVLGGGKIENTEEMLHIIENSMKAGCKGCLVGRNIWQHKNPSVVLKALKKIVHENSSTEDVIQEFNLH